MGRRAPKGVRFESEPGSGSVEGWAGRGRENVEHLVPPQGAWLGEIKRGLSSKSNVIDSANQAGSYRDQRVLGHVCSRDETEGTMKLGIITNA
jgi:hypothetical protein